MRCIIRITNDRNPDKYYFESIINRYKEISALCARFYILSANNLSLKDEHLPSPYIWIYGIEGQDEYKNDRKVYANDPNPIIMSCYSVKARIPDELLITLELWDKQDNKKDELIGYTEFDLELRWFNAEYQELKYRGLKEIPIESRSLHIGNQSLVQGEVKVWLELLTIKEASEIPEEMLMQKLGALYELRVVI